MDRVPERYGITMSYYDEMRQMQLEEEKKKKYKELAELNKILDKWVYL